MSEMPDFIRNAIMAQGKYAPEEIEERLDELDPETLIGVVDPDPQVEEAPAPQGEMLFDPAAGEAARDEAMRRVDAAAPAEFKQRAWDAILHLVSVGEDFTADDVWRILGETPDEPRALGPQITRASKAGLVFDSGLKKKSDRPVHHRYPMTVWRVAP